MIPLIVPVAIGVALIGLFWPEDKENGKVRKNGSGRGGSDNAGQSLPADSGSDSRSRVVKPADSAPPKPKDKTDEKISADTDAAGDVRGDLPGNDSGSEPDAAPGNGKAEPVTDADADTDTSKDKD